MRRWREGKGGASKNLCQTSPAVLPPKMGLAEPLAPPPGRPPGEPPSLSGAWRAVTCLPEAGGRKGKERAGWTGKSSWASDSPGLSLPLEAAAWRALPPRHMPCGTLGSPARDLAASG